MRTESRIKLYIFLFFLGIYLFSMGDHFTEPFYSIDEKFMIYTTRSLVEGQTLHIPPIFGEDVSKHGILPSIAAIPFYLAGKLVSFVFKNDQNNYVTLYFVYCMNSFITAALLTVFYTFSRYLGYTRKTSFFTTIILGLCTILFPYSRYFFAHPLCSLLLLLSVYHLVRYYHEGEKKYLIGSACWFALLLLTRIDELSLVPVYLLGLVLIFLKSEPPAVNISRLKKMIRDFLYFFAPAAAAVVIHFLINYLKSRTSLKSGYSGEDFTTNLLYGLFGLLFSPGGGVFIFAPPVILGFFSFRRFFRKHSFAAVIIVFICLIRLFVFASWFDWHGGFGWGPRYIIPLVPVFMLFSCEALSRFRSYASGVKFIILFICLAGFLIQLSGVLVKPAEFNANIYGLTAGDFNSFYYIPQINPIAGNIPLIRKGVIDSFILNYTDYFSPAVLVFILFFLAALIGISCYRLKKLIRISSEDNPFRRENASGMDRWILGGILFYLIICVFLFMAFQCFRVTRFMQIIYSDKKIEEKYSSDDIIYLDSRGGDKWKDAEKVLIRWSGYIRMPLHGEHHFFLKARGDYVFQIDGDTMMSNTEKKERHNNVARKEFDAGFHEFRIEYSPPDPENAYIHLYATFPGYGFYKSSLPGKYLFPEKPSFFLKAVIFISKLKFFMIIIIAMILYLAWIFKERKKQNKELE